MPRPESASPERTAPRLTQLSHGAGCACKVPRGWLQSVLEDLPAAAIEDPALLVGSATADDAAVYKIGEHHAIVHTADFFTPIVDDPYDFGRVAATNALSDIYAMGGKPLVALNLVGFPVGELDPKVMRDILRGGADVVSSAGAVIGGGHSIDDREPKYGLAVSGLVDPTNMLTNGGAKPGDTLMLTKPLGTGLIATAAKRDLAPAALVDRALEVMCTLNDEAARSALAAGAHAATDVTGFGLLGHLHEMCQASGVTARITASSVPVIKGATALAENPDAVAGGSRRNAEHAKTYTAFDASVSQATQTILSDAMTSGGLLLALPPGVRDIKGTAIGEVAEAAPGGAEPIVVS